MTSPDTLTRSSGESAGKRAERATGIYVVGSARPAKSPGESSGLAELLKQQLMALKVMEAENLSFLGSILGKLPDGALRSVVYDLHEASSAFSCQLDEIIAGNPPIVSVDAGNPAAPHSETKPCCGVTHEPKESALESAKRIVHRQVLEYGTARNAARVLELYETELSLHAMVSCAEAIGCVLRSIQADSLVRVRPGPDRYAETEPTKNKTSLKIA